MNWLQKISQGVSDLNRAIEIWAPGVGYTDAASILAQFKAETGSTINDAFFADWPDRVVKAFPGGWKIIKDSDEYGRAVVTHVIPPVHT